MATIRHPATGLAIGDPDLIPLNGAEARPTQPELDAAVGKLILSASGWRTVFAVDGDEESPATEIGGAREVIAATAASVFAAYLKEKSGRSDPLVIIGMDSRPTGPAIADVMTRAFLAEGCRVRHLFIVAAPEIMAYARSSGAQEIPEENRSHGFAYVSASHNPIGHNGIKFGLVDGGVLGADEAKKLIASFEARMRRSDRVESAAALVAKADPAALSRIYANCTNAKRAAHSAYLLFTREVVTGAAEATAQDVVLDRIAAGMAERPIGIVADFNGSARTLALDVDLLASLGVKIDVMNGRPGGIAHRIVPEGESLDPCRHRLEELHATDPSFVMGYVPDCDGDRGNVVVWDEATRTARSLEAQEVFALCCVAELAHLVWTGALRYDLKGNALDKVAVAINDPTSMRVDRIAQAFDVAVFRAEVGEANVVGLARRLREQGNTVRILGEGAAGGNITHPSAVRDPIDTVFALLKLLTIRSDGEKSGLFELWCDLSDQAASYRDDFTLSDIIATLPSYITTSAYERDAGLKITAADHGALKDRYREIFLREWEEKKGDLRLRYGFASWEAIAYNGLDEKRGITRFGEAGRGGLKILFLDEHGHERAYLWMRGSGTEPIFRVMADVAGADRRIERELLEWQRRMITEADSSLATEKKS